MDRQIIDQETESVLDDFQSSDLDIESLRAKFINPIERYRSKNSPIVTGGIKQNDNNSTNSPKESRAHTFYRMLGLPVIAPDGRFFNPGFNPKNDEIEKHTQIANAIPQSVKSIVNQREAGSRERMNRFSFDSAISSVYGLALADPRGQRLLMSMDESINALEKGDPQKKSIPHRREFITTRYKLRNGEEITQTFNEVEHILRPFCTDPIISSNLDPTDGTQNVLVGAPFLEKEDREISSNLYVKLPGIEFILRLRLLQHTDQSPDGIDFSAFTDIVSSGAQREIAATLENVGVNDSDINQALKGSSLLELYTLDDLVKTYKGLISLYLKNIEIIEDVYTKIIWVPLPSKSGPEKGTQISTRFVTFKNYLDSWEIDRRISSLQTKSVSAKRQTEIGEDINFSDFTISEFQNLSKVFNEKLKESQSEHSRLETAGSNALRAIEYISGEVSGLGLIDIIAIYMAMWSVDTSVLLNLIDDQAAQRLSQIPELQTQAVKDRLSTPADSLKAYKTLEGRIMSILSYGDRLYDGAKGSPNNQKGGDIERTIQQGF